MNPLTTTSHAVLTVLAWRPCSAYEIVTRLRRPEWTAVFTRTASRLYLEPKNLVRRGLAVGQVCSTGERRRTVYEITASGRQALTDWIHKAPRGMSTEFEALLRLAAPGVTPGAVVQQVRACAAAQLHMARQAATAAHSADFDQSTHHRLVAEFEVHLARAQMEWAAWAEGWLAQTRPQPSRAEPTFAEPRTAEPTMPAATDWASWLD